MNKILGVMATAALITLLVRHSSDVVTVLRSATLGGSDLILAAQGRS
jgi:hypothetical protein